MIGQIRDNQNGIISFNTVTDTTEFPQRWLLFQAPSVPGSDTSLTKSLVAYKIIFSADNTLNPWC